MGLPKKGLLGTFGLGIGEEEEKSISDSGHEVDALGHAGDEGR